MPDEMKYGNHSHADSEIHMPYKELFDPRDLQFKVYLYGQENTEDGSNEKSEQQSRIPYLPVRFFKDYSCPVEKIGEGIE
jgi:hypothetical protein